MLREGLRAKPASYGIRIAREAVPVQMPTTWVEDDADLRLGYCGGRGGRARRLHSSVAQQFSHRRRAEEQDVQITLDATEEAIRC